MDLTPQSKAPEQVNSFLENNARFAQTNKGLTADAAAHIANTGDVNTATTLAAVGSVAANTKAISDHMKTYNSKSWWQSTLGHIKHDLGNWTTDLENNVPGVGVMFNWSAKPEQEVQRDYKFLSSVYEKHGVVQGLIATIPVVAGGVIGTAAGALIPGAGETGASEAEGALLGSEAGIAVAEGEMATAVNAGKIASAATRLGRTALKRLGTLGGGMFSRDVLGNTVPAWKNSVKDSNNPNFQADIGRQISHGLAYVPGFASLKDTDTGAGQIVSGVLDAVFDFKTDPLLNLGKLRSAIKDGAHLAEAKNIDGTVARDAAGKPIVAPTMRIAAQSDSVNSFFTALSGRAYTADQIIKVFAPVDQEASKLTQLGQAAGRVLNPFVNAAASRGIEKLAKMDNAAEIKKVFPQFTDKMAVDLAKADTPGKVIGVMGQALYSAEYAAKGGYLSSLVLPSMSLAKNFAGDTLANIRKNSQATNFQDTANFLLPKRVAVLDESGKNVLKNANGDTVFKLVKPVIAGGGFMNALAGKARTFTGMKAIAFSPTLLKYSGKSVDWADQDASNAVFNVLYTSMPYQMALEKTAQIMAAPLNETKSALFHQAQMEVLKNAGVPASTEMFNKIVAAGKRASLKEEQKTGIWGYTNQGDVIGQTLMKPHMASVEETYREPYLASTGLFEHHAAGTAMLDYQSMRQALRATKAYGILYNKIDDFFLGYTNIFFAPLALLNAAFGQRVAIGEAMHQVLRKGLGDYLQNRVAATVAGYKFEKDAVVKRLVAKTEREAKAAGLKPANKEDVLSKEKITEGDHAGIATAVSMSLLPSELDRAAKLANENPDEFLKPGSSAWKALKDSKKPADIMDTNEAVAEAQRLENRSKGIIKKAIELGVQPGKLTDAFEEANSAIRRINPVGAAALAGYKIYPYSLKHKIDVLTEKYIDQGWKGADAGIDASHSSKAAVNAEEEAFGAIQRVGKGSKPGEQIVGLHSSDPHFKKYIAVNLSQMAKSEIAQSVAKDFLKAKTKADLNKLTPDEQWAKITEMHIANVKDKTKFSRARGIINALDEGVPESVAANQVNAIRGLVEGHDGTLHTKWLQNIANGKNTFEQDIRNIPAENLPLMVTGRHFVPNAGNIIRRIENFGFRTAVNPIMNWLSRDPIYSHFYYENYIKLEGAVADGVIDKATAQSIASMNAVKEISPLIHNPQLRSQFAVMHRVALPFYFAQEQAMKRAGRLILSHPQVLRDLQVIHHGLNNGAFIHQDSNGQKHIVYPMIGETGNLMVRALQALGINVNVGLPETVTGNLSSLNTVLPEVKVPSTGTFVSVLLNEVHNLFPWMKDATQKVTNISRGGYPAQSIVDTFIPNSTVRDIWNSLQFSDKESVVVNAQVSAMRAAIMHGDMNWNGIPFSQLDAEYQQKVLDRIVANAKSNLFLKGLLAFMLPLSPNVSNDDLNKAKDSLSTEYLQLIKPTSQGGLGLTHQEAWDKFSAEHGSQSVAYTIFGTKNMTNGARVPLNQTTLTWLDKNQGLIDQYPTAAAYLIPQSAGTENTKDSLAISQKLLAMHLRGKQTPAEFLNSVYVQMGWNDIQADFDNYKEAMNKAQGNPALLKRYSNMWDAFAQEKGMSNPLWYENYSGKTKKINAFVAVNQLNEMNQKGLLEGKQYTKIKDMLENYNNFNAQLASQVVDGKRLRGYSFMVNQWFNYCTSQAKDPDLTSIVNGIFKRVG